MNKTSKILSIIAYYFSEYNVDALNALCYRTYSEAFRSISLVFGRENNYLKLRRDEFDALPESSSTRAGWRNRPAAKDIIEMSAYLRKFNFDELTGLVKSLISNYETPFSFYEIVDNDESILPDSVENLINSTDKSAGFKIKTSDRKIRVYNSDIIYQLKSLYSYRCQICGCVIGDRYGSHLIHAHHIDYFSKSLNNNASNILIVCPNHHGIIHDTDPVFNRNNLTYNYPNGFVEKLKINLHL